MKKQIVIAQRGWIFIGDVSELDGKIRISNAMNIRRWGTTNGLGEIAINGPTKNTVLDPMGVVTLHTLSVVATIDCDSTKWEKV